MKAHEEIAIIRYFKCTKIPYSASLESSASLTFLVLHYWGAAWASSLSTLTTDSKANLEKEDEKNERKKDKERKKFVSKKEREEKRTVI